MAWLHFLTLTMSAQPTRYYQIQPPKLLTPTPQARRS